MWQVRDVSVRCEVVRARVHLCERESELFALNRRQPYLNLGVQAMQFKFTVEIRHWRIIYTGILINSSERSANPSSPYTTSPLPASLNDHTPTSAPYASRLPCQTTCTR